MCTYRDKEPIKLEAALKFFARSTRDINMPEFTFLSNLGSSCT